MLDGHCCFLPDLLPNDWLNFIVFIARLKTLELSSPKVNKIWYDILEQQMKPFPR